MLYNRVVRRFASLLLAAAALLAAVPSAGAEVIDAGALRADVAPGPWDLRVTGARGEDVLREAAAARLGFRTPAGWFRATRVASVRRDGAAVVAEVATTDPAGRRMTVRLAPDADGVLALEATVTAPDVQAMGIGFAAEPDERYLGFGERANAVDQRGRDVEVFVADGPYQPEERPFVMGFVPPQGMSMRDDATYFPMPWLLSTAGYGFLLDNQETSTFHLASERPDTWSVEAPTSRLAFRVFAGPTPVRVLERFTARIGRQPRVAAPWMLGAWMQPSGGAQEEPRLAAMRRADVPVSVAETFLHYLPCADHLPDREKGRRRAAALRAHGVAVLAYFNPMICTDHPAYDEAARAGVLHRDRTGRPYQYRYTGSTQFLVSQFDFTAPGAEAFYGRLLREAIDDGFDGWMEDFGEYTPQDAVSHDGTSGARMHNLYPVLYHRAATRATANAGRPIANYIRSGFTGVAPYARAVWGGDPTTDWGFDGLESAVYAGLTMGTSGISTWGSDIGGFFGLGQRRLTPELLKRWIEFGVVSGVMRTQANGFHIPARTRPQVFDPEILETWRRYAKLRTQLLPYLQAADAEYQRSGLPMMRSLALLHPGDARLAAAHGAFMFGPDLLAAPVVRPGVFEQRVPLPPGTWVDFWRSAGQRRDGGLELTRLHLVRGGRDTTIPAPVGRLPLLARAGTILPLLAADVDSLSPYRAPGVVSLADRRDRMAVLAFPRGTSHARPFGRERMTSVEARRGGRWTLRIDGARTRRYRVQAALGALRRPFRPCAVTANGRRLRGRGVVRYDRRRRILRLVARGRRVRIVATRACPLRRRR